MDTHRASSTPVRRQTLALVCALSVGGWGKVAHADPGIGSPAPHTPLPDGHGHTVTFIPPRDGVLVVDFFATWCGPCHEAIAALSEITRSAPGRVHLVIVDVGEDPATVSAYFAQNPLPQGVTVVLDRDGHAAGLWGQHRFPTTFLLDATGVIRHINRGYGPGYPQRLQRWVTLMLGG